MIDILISQVPGLKLLANCSQWIPVQHHLTGVVAECCNLSGGEAHVKPWVLDLLRRFPDFR